MLKLSFGKTDKFVPTMFCKNLCYLESKIKYPINEISFKLNKRGCVLELPFDKEEHIYGLGLQLKGFELTGKKFKIKPNADPIGFTGDSHAPVPFFVSTKGYGIFIDTLRYAEFNFGVSKGVSISENKKVMLSTKELYDISLHDNSVIAIQIPVSKGVDIYIFEGDTITDIVSEYNRFSGGGCDVPEWGFGLFYRCYADYNQKEVLDTASYFKEKNIPCSVIGIEPGWQTARYSCSFEWDKNAFPNPKSMIKKLYSDGYHINLWEHAFTSSKSPIYEDIKKYSGNYLVWQGLVPDFTNKKVRKIFADYHNKNVAYNIIDGYKLDECDNSDFTGGWSFPESTEFPSKIDGEEYHSIIGNLYMQTILDSLKGKSTYSEVRCAGALSSSYPFVLYSDLYDHKDFIRGVVSSGFSGLLWTPEVRHADSKEEFIRRLQSNVFSSQCLINAWYCKEMPWKKFDCENEVRDLINLRMSLIPSLKKSFSLYKDTGKPPIRALVSDYTDDIETYKIDDEYIFCDDMIVAPIAVNERGRKVYLPKGNWIDFYTKEKINSGWFDVETDNIPVYIKIK